MFDENYVLQLNPDFIAFDSVTRSTSVFYDETNGQIFVVKDRGAGGVDVKGPDSRASTTFRLDDKGSIISVKFSPTCGVLAVQRSQNAVEFINFANGIPVGEYGQCCRAKGTKIMGFIWTCNNEMVFVTDIGLEFYQVIAERKAVKTIKSFSISVNWYTYQPRSGILLLSTGPVGNILQAFQFRPNSMYKLSKFEVDLSVNTSITPKLSLFERDVALINLYGKTCLLVLKHETATKDNCGAQIVIYTFQKEGPPKKTQVLELQLTGRFAISTLDDLVLVHHQTSQTSLIFDICLPTFKTESNVTYHSPVAPPYTIKPFTINDSNCELYSTNWVVFQPNVIIDAKLGCLWLLQMNFAPLCKMISSPTLVVDFLLMRRNSKSFILNVCKETMSGESGANILGTVSFLFNKLNRVYKDFLETSSEAGNQKKVTTDADKSRTIVDQSDMYSSVFSVFSVEPKMFPDSFAIAVLFEYILSLVEHHIPVQYLVYELLINILVKCKKFYQLHQFLQYHVFTDSKPLACLLLSLQSQYPHAMQLALDMFKRLSVSEEDIVDIFLSQYDVIRALRYIQSHGNIESVSARKFLEITMKSGDNQLFYSLFKFFEERNMRLRGSPAFVRGEHCDLFVDHFQKLFGIKSSVAEKSNGQV